MILTIPLTIVYFIIRGLLFALPNSQGLPDVVSTLFSYVFGFLYAFDFLLPVSTVVLILSISLIFELAVQAWHGIHWVLRKIPALNIR